MAITKDGALHIWGHNTLGDAHKAETKEYEIPTLLSEIRFSLPNSAIWENILRWMFLGRFDGSSVFFHFPLEVIMSVVNVSMFG